MTLSPNQTKAPKTATTMANLQTLTNTNVATGSFINTGTLKASGSGTSTISIPLTNTATGLIDVATGWLSISILTNLSGTTLTGGSYDLTGVLELNITGGNLLTNAATILLNGPYSLLVNQSSANALGTLTKNTGTRWLFGGRTLIASATNFANSGMVIIGDGTSGSTLSMNGAYTQTAGTTVVVLDGRLTATASTVAIEGVATVAMRYQHATFDRDQAIAKKLGALMRAASEAEPEPVAAVASLPR